MKITPLQDRPLNRLFVALNHYISTGDHVGEGVATPEGTIHQVLLAHRPSDATDAADWEKLQARLDELKSQGLGLKLTDEGRVPNVPGPGGPQQMHLHALHVPTGQVAWLTSLLREKPGPLGWGSFYETLRAHGLTDEGTDDE